MGDRVSNPHPQQMAMKYRPLPDTFTKDGYEYALLKRSGDVGKPSVVLLQKSKLEHVNLAKKEGRKPMEHFEVVLVRLAEETYWEHSKVTTPARELLPNAESWGRLGWTYSSREAAEQKFAELAQSLKKAPKKPVKLRKKGKVAFGE